MSRRRKRRTIRQMIPFDSPGQATLWSLIAVPASWAVTVAGFGFWGLVGVALACGLAGCYDPKGPKP
jgi:hypothetical protein